MAAGSSIYIIKFKIIRLLENNRYIYMIYLSDAYTHNASLHIHVTEQIM